MTAARLTQARVGRLRPPGRKPCAAHDPAFWGGVHVLRSGPKCREPFVFALMRVNPRVFRLPLS